jgi:transposase
MSRKKNNFSTSVKKQVVIETLKGEKTLAQISAEYGVAPNRIYQWKKIFLENCEKVFSDSKGQEGKVLLQQKDHEISKLQQKIGELVIENDFYKKKFPH